MISNIILSFISNSVALTEEDVRRFLQDENVDFLNCMREYCDIRRIAASLLSKNMIGRGQFDNLIKASTPEEAASLCYSFLYSDPSVNKLEKLSTALREDERCDSHKRLAEKIDQFLQQGQGTLISLYYLVLYIHTYVHVYKQVCIGSICTCMIR